MNKEGARSGEIEITLYTLRESSMDAEIRDDLQLCVNRGHLNRGCFEFLLQMPVTFFP